MGISILQFAKLMGLASRSTVYDAINSGKLHDSVKQVKGKWVVIDVEAAKAEWAQHYRPDDGRGSPKLRAKLKKAAGKAADQDQPDTEPEKGQTPSKAVSEQKLAALKVRQAEIELAAKVGKLVDREKINKAMFAAGQEIREAFLALPDRVVDDILAASDRNEAHTILFEAIALTLERMGDPNRLIENKMQS